MTEKTTETTETTETNNVTIKCNFVPRQLMYGNQLTEEQRADFDYLSPEDLDGGNFVSYKGQIYDLSQFMALDPGRNECFNRDPFRGFDGYMSDSYFSGVLVKYCQDRDYVIMATYFS